QTVTITANDGKGGISATTFALIVWDVPPTATFNAPSTVAPGDPISLSLTSPVDPSPVDTAAGFTYAFDCGTGSGYGAFVATNTASCPTTASGTRTVKGKVMDKDGSTESSAIVTIKSESFSLTGSMLTARSFHTATLLSSGKVLIAGGLDSTGKPLASGEVYDPVAKTFSATANNMPNKASGHTATLLPSGKVLIAGGGNSSAELYDPTTNTFSATGGMTSNRSFHTATLLPNGRVLIAGGSGNSGAAVATALLYDPPTASFISTGSMAFARERHTATLLPDGTVLITGGRNGTTAIASAEVYNPATGTFSTKGSMSTARFSHRAVLLTSGANSGKVLVEGGSNGTSDLATAEIYDPAVGTFSSTGSLAGAREAHTATLLNDGRVLVVAGVNGTIRLNTAELYAPANSGFIATGSLVTTPDSALGVRSSHTATLLSDGSVLVAGGIGSAGVSIASAERYNSGP
ncbi:MAG: kelch-like protein, partial [Acidobacteria bacterium]|nr:kelch-like protein [Acidobacteriota bacterium]